jgi:two-component system, NarL family, response regulator LiaR
MALRILLADDHALFREGLRQLLTAKGFEIVGEAGTGVEAVEEAQRLTPDLVVLDLDMPEMDGLEATRLIKTALPDMPVVILTASERETNLFESVKSGALGYVLKTMTPSDLIQQIEAAARGESALSPELATKVLSEFSRVSSQLAAPPRPNSAPSSQTAAEAALPPPDENTDALTAREREVLERVIAGESNKEIASAVFISENTVKYHLKNILRKLHVNNRAQVVAWAMRQEWYVRRAAEFTREQS